MPFTAAHPAAVLPLGNRFPRFLPWSGLVVGSIAPDFVYFSLGRVEAASHSIPGLFTFCLPMGLLIWLVFQFVVKRPLAYLLPDSELGYLWSLAGRRPELSIRAMAGVALAVLVGAASHVLLDSLTHDGGWAVAHIGFLSRTITVLDGYRFTGYRIVQHGGTLVGFAMLAVAYLRWRRRQVPAEHPPRMPQVLRLGFLAGLVVAPVVLATIYMLAGSVPLTGLGSLTHWLWRFVTSVIAFGLAGVVVYALFVRVLEARLIRRRIRAT